MYAKSLLLASALLITACGKSDLAEYDDTSASDVAVTDTSAPTKSIKIVGSSTVSPFATTVAEQFGAASDFPTPIVETTGTGGGFKAFCLDIGPDTPSISNASRPIKVSEKELCASNGVTDLVEVKIGFDGIVVANAKDGAVLDVTKEQLFRALAAELPDGDGGFVANPNKTWADVDASLPDQDIMVFGPPPTSGTRDAFVEIAMEKGAAALPEMKALKDSDKAAFKAKAHTLRGDGGWIDSGENDTAIIQTLVKNPDAIGVFGYSFLEQNADRVKGASVGGVAPTFENIASGDYGVSRSMFFYVKSQNEPMVPGLTAYIDEFTKDSAWGPDGYLAEKGLIPLPDAERAEQRESALALTVMH